MTVQHIRRCPKCEQYRHVSWFREYALMCRECESELAFEHEGKDWEQEQVENAKDRIKYGILGTRHFDMAASYLVQKERYDKAIDAAVGRILAGPEYPGVAPQAWRIIQARVRGGELADIAKAEGVTVQHAETIEAKAMKIVVAAAKEEVDGRSSPPVVA